VTRSERNRKYYGSKGNKWWKWANAAWDTSIEELDSQIAVLSKRLFNAPLSLKPKIAKQLIEALYKREAHNHPHV